MSAQTQLSLADFCFIQSLCGHLRSGEAMFGSLNTCRHGLDKGGLLMEYKITPLEQPANAGALRRVGRL